ncbi:uncharacterized protein [Rutidosis leptorrhynchoides]|uniref:uncharacterized protein n=1 Tax=Rutidosis leptorrhynchoides TaxID=125765 RepID=UPI003A9958C3
MSDEDGSYQSTNNKKTSDLASQLTSFLKTNMFQQPKLSDTLKISLSLNSSNYAPWSRMIKVAIEEKSKALLNHLTTNPPETTDEKYEKWEQEDLIVFSWLIQNIEPNLASNLTEFQTAKMLWDALVTTYSSGRDKLQTFDFHVRANEIKQSGKSIEDLWISLQGVWGKLKEETQIQ